MYKYVNVLSLFHSLKNYNMQKKKGLWKIWWRNNLARWGTVSNRRTRAVTRTHLLCWCNATFLDPRRKTDSAVDRPRRDANKSEWSDNTVHTCHMMLSRYGSELSHGPTVITLWQNVQSFVLTWRPPFRRLSAVCVCVSLMTALVIRPSEVPRNFLKKIIGCVFRQQLSVRIFNAAIKFR
jgi:hypothetical protein